MYVIKQREIQKWYQHLKKFLFFNWEIYYDKNISHVQFNKDLPHYVYLGSNSSGKSVTAVIPMISFIANAKKQRSIFVTDPKGEIYHTTSKILKDKGYKIFAIDFRHPELSNHINILEPIIKEY